MSGPAPAGWAPFAYGFRPFFLLAGLYAVVSIGAWLAQYPAGAALLAGMPPQYWHGHEMLFGFVSAAIAGFLLTAVPSWTGERGFAGRPLVVLVLLWLCGRTAFMAAHTLPTVWLAAAELVFLPALFLTIAPSLFRSRSRNRPLLFVLLAFWVADGAFIGGLATANVSLAGSALRAALHLVLLLITVVGGRIVPAFTGNALRSAGVPAAVKSLPWLEKGVVTATVLYLVADMMLPQNTLVGVLAALAAVLHALRLSCWQGWRTLNQPIVWVLHVGYAWLPLGFVLRALHELGGMSFAAHWQHAFGAGAAGTMILAVMTRAALGHTGRPLRVSRVVAFAYMLVTAAVLLRVFGTLLPGLSYIQVVTLSGCGWVLAFVIFSLVYAPILMRSRADGRPG